MSAHSSSVRIRFPRVLDQLGYEGQVSRRERIVDGKKAVEWYCSWATQGMQYERFVQSSANLGHPNCITQLNVDNLRNLSAGRFGHETSQRFVDKALPELQKIPLDACLFETKEFDRDAVALVNSLCRLKRVKLTNATKLLYQKRRHLIPILDEFARLPFDLPWMDGPDNDFSQVVRMAFWNLREFEALNSAALDELQQWAESNPDVTASLQLSRLRMIDILAWVAIKRDDFVL